MRSPSGVQRGKRKQEMPPSAWARTRKASHIGADMNHLWPVSSYSAPGPPPFSGAGDGGVGADVGAALLLGHPHPGQGAGLLGRGRVARVVVGGEEARLPLLGQLGLVAQRRDHRVGHRDRAADAGLGLAKHMKAAPRATWAPGCGSRPGQRVQLVRDRRRRAARARRGGTRPRRPGCRSGRGCAASAGSRWPAGPSSIAPRRARRARRPRRSAPRPSRRPRGRPPRPAPGRPRRRCSRPAAAAWLATSWVRAGRALDGRHRPRLCRHRGRRRRRSGQIASPRRWRRSKSRTRSSSSTATR